MSAALVGGKYGEIISTRLFSNYLRYFPLRLKTFFALFPSSVFPSPTIKRLSVLPKVCRDAGDNTIKYYSKHQYRPWYIRSQYPDRQQENCFVQWCCLR